MNEEAVQAGIKYGVRAIGKEIEATLESAVPSKGLRVTFQVSSILIGSGIHQSSGLKLSPGSCPQ